jgi:hypothetical protein
MISSTGTSPGFIVTETGEGLGVDGTVDGDTTGVNDVGASVGAVELGACCTGLAGAEVIAGCDEALGAGWEWEETEASHPTKPQTAAAYITTGSSFLRIPVPFRRSIVV